MKNIFDFSKPKNCDGVVTIESIHNNWVGHSAGGTVPEGVMHISHFIGGVNVGERWRVKLFGHDIISCEKVE